MERRHVGEFPPERTVRDDGNAVGVRLRRYDRADYDSHPVIRQALLDVNAEVYAAQIATDPFFSADRFADRLDGHVAGERWEAVIGFDGDQPVGYAYGCALGPSSRWWSEAVGLDGEPLAPEFTAEDGHRTLGLFELMVRVPWRKTGTAKRLHDELVAGRPERRVVLGNNAGHVRVREMYERWGCRKVGTARPFPDSPLYNEMVLNLQRRST